MENRTDCVLFQLLYSAIVRENNTFRHRSKVTHGTGRAPLRRHHTHTHQMAL